MTIAGLWRYGDWRHVTTGCTALVLYIYSSYDHEVRYVHTVKSP